MILLHRVTSFTVAIVTGVIYALLIFRPQNSTGFFIVLGALLVLLIARLLKWEFKRFSFWVFCGTPLFFFASSILFFLFLEDQLSKIILATLVTFGVWLYTENIFSFYHLPSTYQPYALEYLSLTLYIGSAFFFTSGSYAAQLFLNLPVWLPALAVFWAVLFATIGVFWVSKIPHDKTVLFGITGAVLMTELYMMLAQLPTGFIVNASVFSVFLYLYLGISRAHALDKLTKVVLNRYVSIGIFLILVIFLTAKWT